MAAHEEGSPDRRATVPALVAALGLVIAMMVIGAVFLWPFLSGRSTTPFGFDTPHYIWRSHLVSAQGLDALSAMPDNLNANAERPAYPIFASLVASISRIDAARLAYVVPAVFAVAIGLAAGAFALEVLEEPPWSFAIYAIVVGASLAVVGTAVGSLDNLMVDSVLLAGATAAFISAEGRRGAAGAVLILAAAVMIHWILALVLLGMLGLTALLLIPDLLVRRRNGEAMMATPAVRLAAIAGGSAAAGALGLQLIPGLALTPPVIRPEKVAAKVESRPALRFTFSGPLAALGAVALWRPATSSRRRGLLFLVVWAGSVALAILIYLAGARDLPTYRAAEFGLAIPILAAAPPVWLIHAARGRLGQVGAIAGAGVAAVVVLLAIWGGGVIWRDSPTLMAPDRVKQLATAASYLENLPAGTPVIVVAHSPRFTATDRVARSGMPADLIATMRTFIGDAGDLLASRPTKFLPENPLAAAAAEAWPTVRPLLGHPFVAIYLSSFNPGSPPPDGAAPLAAGVSLLRGPAPVSPVVEAPPPGPAPGTLLVAAAVAILLLVIAGSGWTAGLISASRLSQLAIAPAVGLAVITIVGISFARFGMPVRGGLAWAIIGVSTLGGWLTLLITRRPRLRMRPRTGRGRGAPAAPLLGP